MAANAGAMQSISHASDANRKVTTQVNALKRIEAGVNFFHSNSAAILSRLAMMVVFPIHGYCWTIH
jgi:hypothetical protein